MASKLKVYGTRLPESAIHKIKMYARATGKTDNEALCLMIESFQFSPAIKRAVDALTLVDKSQK